MFGISECIVGLWFLPVTLCIIIPLAMLIVWCVVALLTPRKNNSEDSEI